MVAHLDAMVARYRAGEPLQYVLGRWSFRHLDLAVDRRVLIPRPETELVAGVAIELAAAIGPPRLVADLGTGSGAIGLSLAAELPLDGTTVWITDASEDALAVARGQPGRHRPRGAATSASPTVPGSRRCRRGAVRRDRQQPALRRRGFTGTRHLGRRVGATPKRCSPEPTGSTRSARSSRAPRSTSRMAAGSYSRSAPIKARRCARCTRSRLRRHRDPPRPRRPRPDRAWPTVHVGCESHRRLSPT